MTENIKTLSLLPGGARHEHADWQIGPVGVHRDSDTIARSNWRVTLARFEEIDPEGTDYEVHRFGHWAVGWIEEIAYRPDTAIAGEADRIRASLAGYAILDEDDQGELEMEDVSECWESWQEREVRRDLVKIFVARNVADPDPDDMSEDEIEDWIEEIDADRLWALASAHGEVYCEGSSASLRLSVSALDAIADALATEGGD